jgi:hypothetical protein
MTTRYRQHHLGFYPGEFFSCVTNLSTLFACKCIVRRIVRRSQRYGIRETHPKAQFFSERMTGLGCVQ